MADSNFTALLTSAVEEPGRILDAYTRFYNYSLGNQMLAMGQCMARGIEPGPIATFQRWKELGRYVQKGQKAIELCMPVTMKRRAEEPGEDDATFTRFIFRRNWFVLAQTEGAEYIAPPPPAWDKARALAALDVTEIAFERTDGNVQGYARRRSVAVSPLAALPFKTLIHEIAHVVLGHTSDVELSDDERPTQDVREVEAESVALLVLGSLDQPGLEFCRGYIQAWLQGKEIAEKTAQRIFKAADSILKAGTPKKESEAQS